MAYCRLYFTKVQLGTPPVEFYVQIDTGSDVLWVSCSSCSGCPQTSGLQVNAVFFRLSRFGFNKLLIKHLQKKKNRIFKRINSLLGFKLAYL